MPVCVHTCVGGCGSRHPFSVWNSVMFRSRAAARGVVGRHGISWCSWLRWSAGMRALIRHGGESVISVMTVILGVRCLGIIGFSNMTLVLTKCHICHIGGCSWCGWWRGGWCGCLCGGVCAWVTSKRGVHLSGLTSNRNRWYCNVFGVRLVATRPDSSWGRLCITCDK